MNNASLENSTIEQPTDTEKSRDDVLEAPSDGSTLLWRSAARSVTLATGVATLSIRAGVGVGRWGLNAGRRATHGVIGLNQTVLEAILKAAGSDVSTGTQVALRQEDAGYLVDKWVRSLHMTLSAASILAASGFYLAESAMYWTSDSSLNGLHFLNALFGSTETSRAVAAIISSMKQELYKPGLDGSPSEISTLNLLTTVASFLFLQRNGRRQTEIEWRSVGGDATVWDIVIDDRGFRADVLGTRRQDAVITSSRSIMQSPVAEDYDDDINAFALQVEDGLISNTVALSTEDQTSLTDEEIRQRIAEQLPEGTKATITTDTMMLKTVRVNIQGPQTTNIEAPPGMVMISEHPNFENSLEGQTVIFRTASKVQSRADLSRSDRFRDGAVDTVDTDEGGLMMSLTGPSSMLTDEPEIAAAEPIQRPESSERNNTPMGDAGPLANQKKQRRAPLDSPISSDQRQSQATSSSSRRENFNTEKAERSGVLKKAFKSLSPSQSSTVLSRVIPSGSRSRSNSTGAFSGTLSQSLRPLTSTKETPRRTLFQTPTNQTNTPLISPSPVSPATRESQNNAYFTVHEKRRESTYSEVDTYSVHSNDSRPPSPTMSRTHLRAANSISKTQSQTEISLHQNEVGSVDTTSRHHRRSRSFVPSLYSMGTKNSGEDALVLAPKTPVPRRSIFEDNKMLMALAKDGKVPGQFPSAHLILTLRRFVRFASAAYGEHFLKVLGLAGEAQISQGNLSKVIHHREHNSFSNHTGLPPETIVKSSFVDIEGLPNQYSQGFSPIIHFVTIDLEAKAIVLTCRGTLGFEDLLTDMACDYTDLYWRGQAYKVHRGIKEAARRLMDSSGGNDIMATLKATLEEYPEFGLVLVGHSLGGAVTALLAIMLSEPATQEPSQGDIFSFVTATKPRLLPSTTHTNDPKEMPPITLPPGRPIHVYAFGSPACVSSALRIATRGLITSVVNANDVVPYLSLGTLHDFRAVAARLNKDFTGAFNNIKQRAASRIVEAMVGYLLPGNTRSNLSAGPPPPSNLAGDGLGEDTWMWNELVEMRKVMTSEKLYPPGEIFTLESTRVFDRNPDESTTGGVEQASHYTPLGRPATRIQFKWVKDVEKRFTEVRFGRTMFHEHSPNAYENNMSALERGVCDDKW